MQQKHGQATIRFNGQVYETADDAVLTVGGPKNTVSMTGQKAFRSQTYMPSKVECKIPVVKGFSLKNFQQMVDVEIIFQSDTGNTYVIRNAAQTGEVSLTGGDDGHAALVFEGEPAEEML